MRDEDDRRIARLSSRAMTSNRRSTSLGLREAVGSSKMMRVGLERERLGDLDELALRGGEVARLRVERDCVLLAEIGENFAAPCRRIAGRDRRPGRPRSGRKMFSSTERSGARLVSCMTMAMPRVERLARAARRLAVAPR